MRLQIFTVGAILLGAGAADAWAQDGRFEFISEAGVMREDPFAPDEDVLAPGGAPFALETGLESDSWLRRVEPLGQGRTLRLEGRLRGQTFFDRSDLDSVLVEPRAQFWTGLADGRAQLRLSASVGVLSRDGSEQWTRPEAEAQLRLRPNGPRASETVLRVRYTEYDFASGALDRLDSERVRYGAEQILRFPQAGADLRLSAFFETADAVDPAFSFEEARLRAELTLHPSAATTLSLAADYRDREYDAALSNAIPTARADQRFMAETRVERALSQRLTAFAAAGYLDSASNIAARDYDGVTFRVGLRVAL